MIAKLVLLFTIVPILELTLLITLGDYIGLPWTIAIVVTTALLGATLGKYQGLSAWRKIKAELSAGQLPQDALMDGLAVLLASAFLITPGVLTDLAAFTLLLPATRAPLKRLLKRRIDRWLESEPIGMFTGFGGLGGEMLMEGYEDPYAEESEEVARRGEVIIERVEPEKSQRAEAAASAPETIEMS